MAAFSATLSAYVSKDASQTDENYHGGKGQIAPPFLPTSQLVHLLQRQGWREAVVLWGTRPLVVASTLFRVDGEEMRTIASAFEAGRDFTIARGLVFQRQRYDMSCYDPPLLYGRRGVVDDSEGIVVAKGLQSGTGEGLMLIVTYRSPFVSAYVVPRVVTFFQSFLGILPLKQPAPSEVFRLN